MKMFWHLPRNPMYLFFAFIGACGFAWFVNVADPTSLRTLLIFYSFVGVIVFFFSMYMFVHLRHALFFTTGTIIYLLLRYFHLRHPFYLILLIICLVFFDMYWSQQKSS